jgi:TorA maturation chaperone TorD
LTGEVAATGLALMRQGLAELVADLNQETLGRLAADYMDIYLTNGLRTSPCESVWLDEDHPTYQRPRFEVRDWYRAQGLRVEDWRKRSDDHLVNELDFLAHLLAGVHQSVPLTEAARFMDEHPLRWIESFAERVADRCSTRFYAGLALLTAAYLDELRDLIARLTGEPRPAPEEIGDRLAAESVSPMSPSPNAGEPGPRDAMT